jgi:hypothetical protein
VNPRDISEGGLFTMSSYEIEDYALPLPLTRSALALAEQFAQQQLTAEKAAQVRLNTLAVCVVNDYLQLMGIPTNLTAGDSWNPVARLCADVADLEVAGIGRLECRPLCSSQPGEPEPSCDRPQESLLQRFCPVPPEVWSDRIGYVVVQIDQAMQQANLLGFVETAAVEQLSIAQLRSPEALLEHLNQLLPVAVPLSAIASPLVHLSQWLQHIFDAEWQPVESLLAVSDRDMAYGFRSMGEMRLEQSVGVKRAKLVALGMQFTSQPLVLVVELVPESDQRVGIRLQLHPTGDLLYLPPNLQLAVLDESKATFLQAESGEADNYMQLQLRGRPGERFSVRVAAENIDVVEDFVI